MNDLPNNFGNKANCGLGCQVSMDNEHSLNCAIINEGLPQILKFDHILNGTLQDKCLVLKIF